MAMAKVAVLRTQPETVLQDYQRLFDLAGGAEALDPNATTILKENISWHYPMPSANTTPLATGRHDPFVINTVQS